MPALELNEVVALNLAKVAQPVKLMFTEPFAWSPWEMVPRFIGKVLMITGVQAAPEVWASLRPVMLALVAGAVPLLVRAIVHTAAFRVPLFVGMEGVSAGTPMKLAMMW